MPRNLDPENLIADSSKGRKGQRSEGLLAILIGMLLGFCILGLMHSVETLGQDEADSVEAGGGIELQEDFEANVYSATLQKKLGFVGLGLIGLYCSWTAPAGWFVGSLSVIGAAGVFFTWVAASTVWSIDPSLTQRELVRIAVYLFLAISIVRRFPSRDVLKSIMACMLVSVGVVYLGEIAVGTFRPWDSDFRMHGSIHSSSLAHHSLVVALCAAALSIDSPRKNLLRLLVVFAVVTIVFSKTRGGLAATIVGLVVVYAMQHSLRTSLFFVTAFVFLGSVAVLLVEVGGPELRSRFGATLALGRFEEISTLTGRLPLWRLVWDDSKEIRLMGAGYGAFWSTNRTFSMADTLEWFPRHSHNAYLETIVDIGFVGLGLLLGLIATALTTSYRMFKETRNVVYAFVVAFLSAGMIDGFVEVIFVSIRELGLFVGIAMCMLMLRNRYDFVAYSKKYVEPRAMESRLLALPTPSVRKRVSGQSS